MNRRRPTGRRDCNCVGPCICYRLQPYEIRHSFRYQHQQHYSRTYTYATHHHLPTNTSSMRYPSYQEPLYIYHNYPYAPIFSHLPPIIILADPADPNILIPYKVALEVLYPVPRQAMNPPTQNNEESDN